MLNVNPAMKIINTNAILRFFAIFNVIFVIRRSDLVWVDNSVSVELKIEPFLKNRFSSSQPTHSDRI